MQVRALSGGDRIPTPSYAAGCAVHCIRVTVSKVVADHIRSQQRTDQRVLVLTLKFLERGLAGISYIDLYVPG